MTIPEISHYPQAFGPPLLTGVMKAEPGDFQVNEVLTIEPSGQGEHLLLLIEKVDLNTEDVARFLAQVFDVPILDIGYCGLKDRRAQTTQWFSVCTPLSAAQAESAISAFNAGEQPLTTEHRPTPLQQLRLLESGRHLKKLRRGAHQGNAFVLRLRQVRCCTVSVAESSDENAALTALHTQIAQRMACIATDGFPNYIGPQRFGHHGRNLHQAHRWLSQPRKRTSRSQRSLWLSAARSALFNAVLAQRIEQGTWQQMMPGEPAVLDGSRSFFMPGDESHAELAQRLSHHDIHPSGPWWGRGEPLAQSACAALEADVLAPFATLRTGLERAGLKQERRALRACADNVAHEWIADDELQLSFTLAPGVFATSLLQAMGLVSDAPDTKAAQ